MADEMTPVEAARHWRVRLETVYHRIWDGSLPARKVDGRWLIPADAVEECRLALERRRKKSGAKARTGRRPPQPTGSPQGG